MNRQRVTNLLAGALGVIYIGAGIAETVRAVRSGDGGIPFWFGTLVGGVSLVLVGLAYRRRRTLSDVLITVGAAAGMLATAWTLVIPVFAMVVIWLTLTAPKAESATAQ